MGGAYFACDENNWEMIGEYYRFANTDQAGGGSKSSNAWFVQAGKTFNAVTPFVRFEKAAFNPLDNYFLSQASGHSYQRTPLGLRYALCVGPESIVESGVQQHQRNGSQSA